MTEPSAASLVARVLGFAGLMPFIGCTAILVLRDDGSLTRVVMAGLISYSAVILSFMGAVHWGRAMFGGADIERSGSKQSAYLFSVIPAIVAWFATLIRIELALVLLMLSFIGLYVLDRLVFAEIKGLDWYLPMRIKLTSVVVICLAVSLAVFQ